MGMNISQVHLDVDLLVNYTKFTPKLEIHSNVITCLTDITTAIHPDCKNIYLF